MKTDKRMQLLKILSDASQSISSAALANMLGTSERTVRNYIKAINEEGKAVITSSREGYRLESHTASLDTLPNEAESRVWKVLSDLLTSKEGVNAFDEAEATTGETARQANAPPQIIVFNDFIINTSLF